MVKRARPSEPFGGITTGTLPFGKELIVPEEDNRGGAWGAAREAALSAGIMLAAATAPGIPEATAMSTGLPAGVRESTSQMAENVHDAVESGVQGVTDGKEAASAEPVPEPEQVVQSDPPERYADESDVADADDEGSDMGEGSGLA